MSDPVDLHTALPPQLIQSLTDPGTSIQATAAAFLSQETVAGNEFPRGCQLKNTIDQIGNQQPFQHPQVASLSKNQGFGAAEGGRCTHVSDPDFASGINVGIMEFKVQYSDGQYSLKINEDQLHALLLNAEFVLVQMYSEYGLQWNPFLIRWIELYQHLLGKYLETDYCGGHANYERKSNGKGVGGVKVLKLRTAFIGAILNEVEQISNHTPRDYAENLIHYPVDISKFDNVLIRQGVYESREEIPWNEERDINVGHMAPFSSEKSSQRQNWMWPLDQQGLEIQPFPEQSSQTRNLQIPHSHPSPAAISTRRSYFPEQVLGQKQQEIQTQDSALPQTDSHYSNLAVLQQEQRGESLINKLMITLLQAQDDELPEATTSRLIKYFTDFPQHLLVVFDPSESTLSALVQVNPKLTRALVQIYLLSTGRDTTEREDILYILQRLPVNLSVLEMLNHLVIMATATAQGSGGGVSGINGSQPLLTKQEIDILLHGYLSNAMRKAEGLGLANGPSTTPGLYNTIGEAGYFTAPNGGGNGLLTLGTGGTLAPGQGGLTGMQARAMQVRIVQLLCLFIGSLIKGGIMRAEEYFCEIQELGVRYIFVKEARELWQRVNAVKYDSLQQMSNNR